MRTKIYPHNLLQVIALILGSLVCTAIIIFPVMLFQKQFSPFGKEIFNITSVVLLTLLILYISYRVNKKNKVKLAFHFGLPKPKLVFASVLILLLFQIGLSEVISQVLVYFFHIQNKVRVDYSVSFLFGVLLIGPFLEEIIFRGILLEGFLSNYSPRKAIIVNAVLFSIIHWSIIQSTHAFFVGAFIAYVYFRERDLSTSIILHCSSNLIGVILTYWESKHENSSMNELFGVFTLYICIAEILLLLISIRWFFKSTILSPYPKTLQ